MANIKTFYLRVKKSLVMLVEVHPLQPQSCQQHWFQDRHLQETVQIVKEAIETRLAQMRTASKSTQQNSAIITGDSLRLGYVFKTRPSNQQCLVPASCLTKEEQEELEEGGLHSLSLSKEKLIIYACQRQAASPQSMSQLVRVLGEKTNSTTKGVSISSYFQKVSAHTKNSSASSSPSTSTSAIPKSGGKRNILKKIIQKGDSNVSNKRKKSSKTVASKRESSIHHFLHKEKDAEKSNKNSSTDSQIADDQKQKPLIQISDGLTEVMDNNVFESKLDSKSVETVSPSASGDRLLSPPLMKNENTFSHHNPEEDTRVCKIERHVTSLEENIITDNTVIRISQVCNTSVPLSTERTTALGSVTLISVDQMEEIEQQKQATLQMPADNQFNVSLADAVSHDLSCDQTKPHFDAGDHEVSVLPSASFISQSGDGLQSPSFSDRERHLRCNFEESNIKHPTVPSPVYKSDHLSDSADSPVFSKKKTEKPHSQMVLTDLDKSVNSTVDGFRQAAEKVETTLVDSQTSKTDKENKKLRMKRKLPNFSDSDSDDNELPMISIKSRPQKPKFVRLDEMKQTSRKFSISKSFFSGIDKAQPTLSSFLGGQKAKNKKTENGVTADSELNKEELENIDCSLIEELSFIVNVKCETDAEIKREIRGLRDVNELNEEHLNFMVRNSEQYLRDIFEGKVQSSRHLAYKKGGRSKRDLNYGSCLKLYSEEQVDTVMEALIAIFCKRHHKYLDYIMKVLLPEMLIKFHMEIHNLTKEESEQKLLA